MTRDWLLGLVSGLIGTAFGVVLYAVWDLWKEKRANEGRSRALQEIIETDLSTNVYRVGQNLSSLTQELSMLPTEWRSSNRFHCCELVSGKS